MRWILTSTLPFLKRQDAVKQLSNSDTKSHFDELVSFIDRHPRASILTLWIFIMKAVISILTPLSYDFMTTGVLVVAGSISAIISNNAPYVIWMIILKGLYIFWQYLPIAHPSINSMIGYWYFFPTFASQLLIFMMKSPLTFFDFLCGVLTYKILFLITNSEDRSIVGMCLWFLNPYVTLATEMVGQYDVMVAFFLLASLFYFLSGKAIVSSTCLTVSIFLKLYTLLLLPVFIIISLKQKVSNGALKFVSTFALISFSASVFIALAGWSFANFKTLGLYYLSKGFSFFTGITLELRSLGLALPFPVWTPIQIVGLTVIFLALYLFVMLDFWREEGDRILDAVFGFTLIIFAFSFWHSQYLMWVLPFLSIDYVLNRTRWIYPTLFVGTAFISELIYFSYNFSTFGHSLFFVPNYYESFQIVSNLIFHLYENPVWTDMVATFFKSIFVGVCIFYLLRIMLRNVDFNKTNEQL
jgi:hypothetical protein